MPNFIDGLFKHENLRLIISHGCMPKWLYCREITVYPKKYAHGFCFAVLCCGYTLTDFPISIRLTSLALWQSNDCPSASEATLMNMDKYFMWIHYGRLHNHNKAKRNKTLCIFLGLYCTLTLSRVPSESNTKGSAEPKRSGPLLLEISPNWICLELYLYLSWPKPSI